MPTYDFQCNNCKINFEEKLSFKEFSALSDPKRVSCIKCGSEEDVSIVFSPISFSTGPKTIGGLADQNTKKVGKTKREEIAGRYEEKKPKKKGPWYGHLGKKKAEKLFSGSEKEQTEKINKYVREGNE